jgi:hypothetical protein
MKTYYLKSIIFFVIFLHGCKDIHRIKVIIDNKSQEAVYVESLGYTANICMSEEKVYYLSTPINIDQTSMVPHGPFVFEDIIEPQTRKIFEVKYFDINYEKYYYRIGRGGLERVIDGRYNNITFQIYCFNEKKEFEKYADLVNNILRAGVCAKGYKINNDIHFVIK